MQNRLNAEQMNKEFRRKKVETLPFEGLLLIPVNIEFLHIVGSFFTNGKGNSNSELCNFFILHSHLFLY